MKSTINDPTAYKFLALISMIYMSIILCNAILTNRYIGSNSLFVLGGTFTSPFIFLLNDIIAEIYGYKITRSVILSGFFAQLIFVCICQMVLIAPYPKFFNAQTAYSHVLGGSLLWISISGFSAYIIANLLNSYTITKWKILLQGRYFWLRSVGSSAIAEALYSLIAIFLMELQFVPMKGILKIVILSYIIKVIYNIIFSFPAQIFVSYIKKLTRTDVYDGHQKFMSLGRNLDGAKNNA